MFPPLKETLILKQDTIPWKIEVCKVSILLFDCLFVCISYSQSLQLIVHKCTVYSAAVQYKQLLIGYVQVPHNPNPTCTLPISSYFQYTAATLISFLIVNIYETFFTSFAQNVILILHGYFCELDLQILLFEVREVMKDCLEIFNCQVI